MKVIIDKKDKKELDYSEITYPIRWLMKTLKKHHLHIRKVTLYIQLTDDDGKASGLKYAGIVGGESVQYSWNKKGNVSHAETSIDIDIPGSNYNYYVKSKVSTEDFVASYNDMIDEHAARNTERGVQEFYVADEMVFEEW